MHVSGLLCHVFHRKFLQYIWLSWEHLMETVVALVQFSRQLNIKTMSFVVCMIVFIFFTDLPLCSVQISRLYFWVYLFKSALFDNLLWPMSHTLEKSHCVCLWKPYGHITMQRHTLRRNPASRDGFSLWVCTQTKSCIETLHHIQVCTTLTLGTCVGL